MKKIGVLLFLTALSFGLVVSPAQAVPMYYTFEGTVTSTMGESGGLTAGSEVTYTFLVDTDEDGYETMNGVVKVFVDSSRPSDSNDFFFAEYVSGSAVERPDVVPGTPEYSHNYGYDSKYFWGAGWVSSVSGVLASPTEFYDNLVNVYAYMPFAEWEEGKPFGGDDYIYSLSTDTVITRIESQLTLTNITPVNAVPEPSTALLLGSGLLALVGLNRRRKA